MAWLLDINVLIARQDSCHEHHDFVSAWLRDNAKEGWGTCPLIQNGFIRILGNSNYPQGPGSPSRAAAMLEKLVAAIPGHFFCGDDISILRMASQRAWREVGPRSITDLYLLALAAHHGVRFVTLDACIESNLVPGGSSAYYPILSRSR